MDDSSRVIGRSSAGTEAKQTTGKDPEDKGRRADISSHAGRHQRKRGRVARTTAPHTPGSQTPDHTPRTPGAGRYNQATNTPPILVFLRIALVGLTAGNSDTLNS